ncbi:hypothetical protein [Schumannella luteola]
MICGLMLCVVVLLAGCSGPAPVTDAEARIVASSLTSAAKLAIDSDDDDRLCEVLAADVNVCENSWASWEMQNSPMPDLDAMTVAIAAGDNGAQLITFSGTYDDGRTFTNEVTVIGTADGPRALDPVFWVDN